LVVLTIPQTTTASVIVPRGKTSGNPLLRRDWSEEGGEDQDDQTCQFVQENCRQRGINGCRSRACLSDPVSTETQTAGETPLKSARAHMEEDVDGDNLPLGDLPKEFVWGKWPWSFEGDRQ